mgnify:FL=1
MKDGFIKVAAGIPECTVADISANISEIKRIIDKADRQNINILALPELCVTGYTCGDLFFSDTLLTGAKSALTELAKFTEGKYPVVILGLPLLLRSKLYNCAAVLSDGKILGIVPKTHMPNYSEFYEQRQFTSGLLAPDDSITLDGLTVPFGTDIIFCHKELCEYTFGIEICEDVWAASQPSEGLCRAGAEIIINPSASNEVIGKSEYRKTLVSATSARLLCGYLYVSSGTGESTQDLVYSGHSLVYENGTLLAESAPFEEKELTVSEIDIKKLCGERHRNTSFEPLDGYRTVRFSQKIIKTELTRKYEKTPFVPSDKNDLAKRAEAILRIQSYGLKKRLAHTGSETAVIGISGGLDSTLALLVTVRAMRLLNKPLSDIHAVTMPCFGTTERTHSNSEKLCRLFGVSFSEINITSAVNQHFKDISQDPDTYDVTYENSQARERTQVLMDVANKTGGMVIGTGDLSELALGWATYNGDHMSMYAVNSSVPKTLVRYLVRHEAEQSGDELKAVLYDILDTPVSPELLPAGDDGKISQKTEDLVGPYELHDFFLYHMLRFGEAPQKIYRLALETFRGDYTPETVLHWLKVFIRRFFSQQFKRSCLPDGPKVGSVTLSPRGDWRMPSDASSRDWLNSLE